MLATESSFHKWTPKATDFNVLKLQYMKIIYQILYKFCNYVYVFIVTLNREWGAFSQSVREATYLC